MRSAKRTVLAGLLLMGMATAVAPGVPLWASQQAPAGRGAGPGRSGGAAPGPLGAVDALGQELRRPAAPTGPIPRLADGTVDLGDGLWFGGGSSADIATGLPPGESLPLLPWAKALMDDRADGTRRRPVLLVHADGRPARDALSVPLRAELHDQADAHVHPPRGDHSHLPPDLHGRPHASGRSSSRAWFGHSIGAWEKDTLVIDTVGYNDKFWFDRTGTPHTERLHTIERWTRLTKGHDGQCDHHRRPGRVLAVRSR